VSDETHVGSDIDDRCHDEVDDVGRVNERNC